MAIRDKAILEVTNLRKSYGSTVAVDDVSFSVEEGEVFGILGPNGAGKTTTVECIEGLRRRDGGEIRVLGHDPDRDHAALTRVVGVQLQESGLQDRIRVREALDLFGTFYDDPVPATELLDELQLAEVAGTAYAKLSGGQKQRLSIALALIGRPRVAVLDELTRAWTRPAAGTPGRWSSASASAVSRCSSSPTSWRRPSGSATGWRSSTTAGSSRSTVRAGSPAGRAANKCFASGSPSPSTAGC
jgi:ABC-type sugar transport system ATPase subunit